MNYLQAIVRSLRAATQGARDFIVLHKGYFITLIVFLAAFTFVFRNEIDNVAFYIRFINGFIVLLIYIFLLFIKQYRETLVPWDFYTRLRIYILALIAISILTLAPAVMYQGLVAFGGNPPWLRNVISIIGGVNISATTILLLMVFYYRVKR